MSDDHLYDALEVCLQALDQGADIDSCLARYPALADELRPILETAAQARSGAVQEVPVDALRRGRARVLQQAAELREQRRAASSPFRGRPWSRALRLGLASLVTILFLLSGGTGLVSASSGSLPGDQLYPVKRTWEDVQLFFVFDHAAKLKLENKFEQERVQEIHELFSESRIEQVNFQGAVEGQRNGFWQIAGLEIAVDHETVMTDVIVPGSLVDVIGETDEGIIKAEKIVLLALPSQTPVPTPRPTLTPFTILDATSEPENTLEVEATESSSGSSSSAGTSKSSSSDGRTSSGGGHQEGGDSSGGGDDH